MLNGRAAVFLSCSEKFKRPVAEPIRDALRNHGLHAIIVSEEPTPPNVGWEPDAKVQSYLHASDAVLALCTPDNRLEDGTMETRHNITDEIQRARSLPHLAGRIMVLKAPSVKLPSNINPTYDRLDPDDPLGALPAIIEQLRTWGVVPEATPTPSAPPKDEPVDVRAFVRGIGLGEPEKATARAYSLCLSATRESQRRVVRALGDFLLTVEDPEDGIEPHVVGSVLEGLSKMDHTLVDLDLIEDLAASRHTTARITAVSLLDDLAQVAPAEVPLGLVGRLALPATEDWYVQAPAMALTKLLMLRRPEAGVIVDRLSRHRSRENRYAAADAIFDVAAEDPLAPPRDVAERLARDSDEHVREKAQAALEVMGPKDEQAIWRRWRVFGI